MAVYHLCDTCAPAIVNDDYSAFDLDESYSEALASLTAFVERVGYLVDAGTVDPGGYWACDGCGNDEIGSAHAMENL